MVCCAERHLGFYFNLVLNIVAMRMEWSAYPAEILHEYGLILLLSMLLLFCGCGDSGSDSVSADTAVSEDTTVTPTPTAAATPTPAPTLTPTPTPEPEEDSVSADAVSENSASPTEADQDTEVDLSKVTAFEEHRTMYVISNDGVNVRKGPSAGYERLGMLNFGSAIEVSGQDAGGWYQFVYGDGFAFVCDKYVSDTPPATPTEVPPTPTLTPEQQAAATPTPVPAPVPVAAPAGVLMIGDSRCVMMREATGGGGVSWICENGK